MIISDELIERAESLLLPGGKTFDIERRDFIKSLDHRDLMAVPGSGKTTALQAKLYCIAQHLPLAEGRGILVLSHTNTAVDELIRNLQSSCPQLFEYPNFVGTIQQFVDKFLAIPFYEAYYRKSIESIDADRYCKECEKYVNNKSGIAASHVRYKFVSDQKHYNQIRFSYNETGARIITIGINGKSPNVIAPKIWETRNTVKENTQAVLTFLEDMKKYLMNAGILHYDDCYFLAESYLKKNPAIIDVLRKRFQYVFVDEAQDTHKYQLDILGKLFDEKTCDCFQLIGDPNQSIFRSDSKAVKLQWSGKNPRYIKKSIRLTPEISKVVNNLVSNKGNTEGDDVNHFEVEGQRHFDRPIPPHIFLYDETTQCLLISKYEELIRQYNLVEEDCHIKHGFHIIGWAALKTQDPNKLHLEDLFPGYNHRQYATSFSPESLSIVLRNEKLKGDFFASHKALLDALIQATNLCKVKTSDGRKYNKTNLLQLIASLHENEQIKFREELYNCAENLVVGNTAQAYIDAKAFITTWLTTLFDSVCNDKASEFLGDTYVEGAAVPIVEERVDGIPIEIGTIHSVKGRTHCATMYVETYCEGKYECEHLNITQHGETKNPLYGDDVAYSGINSQMARKMMYVGFSRPTHLLCYATQKKFWNDQKLVKMRDQGWIVIDLTHE